MSGSCLEGVWRMSSRRLIALGVILNITKGVKMSTDVTQVQFLSCYETVVFFPVPSTFPKIFNFGVSGRCLEGVWKVCGRSFGIRKKVRAEKSLNRQKNRNFILSNFFPKSR